MKWSYVTSEKRSVVSFILSWKNKMRVYPGMMINLPNAPTPC